MVSRLVFDALSALALTVTALIGAYTPVYLARRDKLAGGSGRSLAFVLGNLFSAGVMVSAGLCHLLGESLRQVGGDSRFPLPTFLCGVGFLLTLIADAVAHSASGHPHGGGLEVGGCCPPGASAATAGLAAVDEPPPAGHCKRTYKNSSQEEEGQRLLGGNGSMSSLPSWKRQGDLRRGGSSLSLAESAGEDGGAAQQLPPVQQQQQQQPWRSGMQRQRSEGDSGGRNGALVDASRGGSGPPGEFRLALDGVLAEAEGAAAGHPVANGSVHSGKGGGVLGADPLPSDAPPPRTMVLQHRGAALPFELQASTSRELLERGGGAAAGGVGGQLGAVSFITAVLMGVALCFHSLLEGAAMGAQESVANSIHIFIAIVSHKGLAAYALGSSIVDSQVSMQQFWSVVLPFTFASPVGIFLGLLISDLARGVGAAAISALASGTFLYVAFMEVIPKELRETSHMAAKMAMLVLGYGLMSLLAVWA